MDKKQRYYRDVIYREICKLFKNRKYNEVIKLSFKYLEILPNDISVRFMRAKSYRSLKKFDEAVQDLQYNLKLGYDSHSLVELYFLYYYLNKYNDAINLLPLMYQTRCINVYSISISELVMKKELGIDMKVSKGDKCDYIRTQIFNYSTDLAIKCINEHAQSNLNDEAKSYFNSNIDLDYLFEAARKNINSNNKANIDEILEVHYFSIHNIGYRNENLCNILKVVVIPNTNKIIIMYPVEGVGCENVHSLDCDYDKLYMKDTKKVKSISQIDKFNKRYKRV